MLPPGSYTNFAELPHGRRFCVPSRRVVMSMKWCIVCSEHERWNWLLHRAPTAQSPPRRWRHGVSRRADIAAVGEVTQAAVDPGVGAPIAGSPFLYQRQVPLRGQGTVLARGNQDPGLVAARTSTDPDPQTACAAAIRYAAIRSTMRRAPVLPSQPQCVAGRLCPWIHGDRR